MISKVIVCNRNEAPNLVKSLSCPLWLTITCTNHVPLVHKSSRDCLTMKFNDVVNGMGFITRKQVNKIKKFISNGHKNNENEFVLVINCNAGKSRSVAVGMWCKHGLGLPVEVWHAEPQPRPRIMEMFGVPFSEFDNLDFLPKSQVVSTLSEKRKQEELMDKVVLSFSSFPQETNNSKTTFIFTPDFSKSKMR